MEVRNQIVEFLEENFMAEFDEDINDDTSLLESGIIDSTGVLELVQFLEEKYIIKIIDDELIPENLDSINNIIKFVEYKLK